MRRMSSARLRVGNTQRPLRAFAMVRRSSRALCADSSLDQRMATRPDHTNGEFAANRYHIIMSVTKLLTQTAKRHGTQLTAMYTIA